MTDKSEATNRHHGGPGSSHQRPDRPDPTAGRGPTGVSTNGPRSAVSGGGGEQDTHHSHDPREKGTGRPA